MLFLRDGGARGGKEEDRESPRSAILAECFNPGLPLAHFKDRLALPAYHAGLALHKDIEFRRAPLYGKNLLLAAVGAVVGFQFFIHACRVGLETGEIHRSAAVAHGQQERVSQRGLGARTRRHGITFYCANHR